MTPVLDRLHEIRAATLVVAGALDETGVARARAVAEAVPQAELRVFDDVGHTPHLESPEAFARITNDFLSSTDPA